MAAIKMAAVGGVGVGVGVGRGVGAGVGGGGGGVKTGGDDLEDNLELDADLLASSDIEGDDDFDGDNGGGGSDFDLDGDDDDGFDIDAVGDNGVESTRGRVAGVKRKASDDAAESGSEDTEEERTRGEEGGHTGAGGRGAWQGGKGDGEGGKDELKEERKLRKKDKEKRRKLLKAEQAASKKSTANTTTTTLVHLSQAEVGELLLSSIRETMPSATPIEIDDVRIPQSSLLDPPDYSPVDSAEPTAHLVKRIESLLPSGSAKKKGSGSAGANGTPPVIILSMSGQRCADVVRAVRDVKRSGEVAKLFAKHFKLADQAAYLGKTRVSIAVGTPARVAKLIEQDALKITANTAIMLDASFVDSKKRTLLTLPEARTELWRTLFAGAVRAKILNGGARIGAF